MNRQFCKRILHAWVVFLAYECVDVSAIYCTNAVTKEPEMRGAFNGSSDWGGSRWEPNL